MYNIGNSSLIMRTLTNLKHTNERFSEKIRGTIIEKWVKYWKLVAKDYKEVAVSVKQDIKNRPLRSSFYFTGASFVTLCVSLNPNAQR